MERESKEEKDHWNWPNEILERRGQEVQEWIPERSTDWGEGTQDGVDGWMVMRLQGNMDR